MCEERLPTGLASAECVKANALCVQVKLGAHEAVLPGGVDFETSAQERNSPEFICAAEIHDATAQWSLEIQLPSGGKWPPWRRAGKACGPTKAVRLDVGGGALLQLSQRRVLEARPYLGLPSAVVALNGRLESEFPRWRKHRDHVKCEAQPDNAPERVAELMRSLETGVVIELRVDGQPETAPMLDQRVYRGFRGDRAERPRAHQAAVERDSVEHFDVRPASDHQPDDCVEAIELRESARNIGEIPASRRRWAPNPDAAVQCPVPRENAADRSHGRNVPVDADERRANSDGTTLAECALFEQLPPNSQDL